MTGLRRSARNRAAGRARIHLEVAPGVHAVEHADTNCYVIVGSDGVTVVDACFDSTWFAVQTCLSRLGLDTTDITGLILTHGHFDHVGFARRARADHQIPVWVHAADEFLAAHPYRYRAQQNRFGFSARHPRALPVLARMVAAGALTVRGVQADHLFADGDILPVPGAPRVIHTPGHTDGECAFLLTDRPVLLSGDALVTLDPYTARTGPRLVAPAATADVTQAACSLERLRGLDVNHVLPGHGRAWDGSADLAIDLVLRHSRPSKPPS